MATKTRSRLYSGDYNYMQQAHQPDGSVIVQISGGRSGQVHRMHVRDLWGEHEEILSEVVIPPGPLPWIQDRLEEAGRGP